MKPSHEYAMRRWAHLLHAAKGERWWDAAVRASSEWAKVLPSFWWALGNTNFGDMLAPAVLARVSGARPVWVSKMYEGKELGLGTILGSLNGGDVVWGAGLATETDVRAPEGSRILAVRGPLTRACIRGYVPEVYGDPAILLPQFHDRPVSQRWDLGLVPHHIDVEGRARSSDPRVRVIDVLRPWPEVVDTIRACEVIASSSLPGLIVAEAYGIPARWISATNIVGGDFKFRDYYLGTQREPPAPGRWSDSFENVSPQLSGNAVHDTEGLLNAWRGLGAASK